MFPLPYSGVSSVTGIPAASNDMSPLLLSSILMLTMFGFFAAGMDFLLLLLLLVSLLMLAYLLLLASLPYGVFTVAINIEIPLILGSHVINKEKNMSVQTKKYNR
jgi:hypothetical protein